MVAASADAAFSFSLSRCCFDALQCISFFPPGRKKACMRKHEEKDLPFPADPVQSLKALIRIVQYRHAVFP